MNDEWSHRINIESLLNIWCKQLSISRLKVIDKNIFDERTYLKKYSYTNIHPHPHEPSTKMSAFLPDKHFSPRLFSAREIELFLCSLIGNIISLHATVCAGEAGQWGWNVIFSSSLLLQPFSPQNLVDLQPTGSIIQEEGLHDFPSNTKIVAENEKNWYKQFAR